MCTGEVQQLNVCVYSIRFVYIHIMDLYQNIRNKHFYLQFNTAFAFVVRSFLWDSLALFHTETEAHTKHTKACTFAHTHVLNLFFAVIYLCVLFCSLFVLFSLRFLENGTLLFSFFILYRYYCGVYSHFLPNFFLHFYFQCVPLQRSFARFLSISFFLYPSIPCSYCLPIFCHWTRNIFENLFALSLSRSLLFAIVHTHRTTIFQYVTVLIGSLSTRTFAHLFIAPFLFFLV